jgi:hypothetical protein
MRIRALIAAGRSASFRERSDQALEYFSAAKAAATTLGHRRDALWGELIETIYLHPAQGPKLLDEFESISDGSPECELRVAIGYVAAASYGGGIEAAASRARSVEDLLPLAADPFVRSSFLHAYTGLLVS